LRATYVIAGGYTVGHLTPGLAVAEELRQRHPKLAVLFAGWADPVEADFVRRAGLPFLALPGAPWVGRGAGARGHSLAAVLPAAWIARRHFRAAGAIGLLSLGSFAAFAPALAARSLGLPVTIFEPNARLGLANRLIRHFAREVLASRLFDPAALPRSLPCEVVGVPLRSALQDLAARHPAPPTGTVHLLVLGGSLGDPFLNARAPGLARRLAASGVDLRVTHQCGRGIAATAVQEAYAQLGLRATVAPFLDPIAPVLASAQFVLTAGGAVTLHEVAAAGVPLLVVPLGGAAAVHQRGNAAAFGQATGCLCRTEETWDESEAAAAIAAVLRDPARWQQQSHALQGFVSSDARAAAVARIVATLRAAARRP